MRRFWVPQALPPWLFGPGGAGLHSTEEYVRELEDVGRCCAALVELAHTFTLQR
jgi:hypothetical protein